jgi:hypothetical protein
MISLTNQKIQFFILFQVSAIQFLQLFCNVLYESTQNLLLTTKYAKSTFTDAPVDKNTKRNLDYY